MATTLYLCDRSFELGAVATTITPKGAWANDGSYPGKIYLPHTQVQDYGWGRNSAFENITTVNSRLLWLGISNPLSGTGTFSGTVDFVVPVHADAGTDMYWRLHIWVSVGNTDAVRGTLVNAYEENTTNAWPNSSEGKFVALQAPVSLTGVSWQAGDRIIVEAGYIARNTDATLLWGRLWYGTSHWNEPYDLLTTAGAVGDVLDGTDENATYGTVNFSQTIPFSADPGFPAPPANDTCATAIVVSSVPYISPAVDARGATQAGDPQPTCGGIAFGSFDGAGIWWEWTPSVSENATFDLVGSSGNGSGSTLSVWTGACGSLTQVACSADSAPDVTAFAVTSGTTYRIMVSRKFDFVGSGSIKLRISTASAPHGISVGPANVSAYGDGFITVTSVAASGGTGPYTYQWHRSTTSGFTPDGTTALTGGTTLTFNDTTAVNNTQYYYKLVATATVGGSATSNQVSALISVPTAVPTPFGVDVWKTNDRAATFLKLTFTWTWTDPDPTTFQIHKCTGLGCSDFASFWSTPGSFRTVDVFDPTNILEDTIYRFRIRAVGSAGVAGPWSNVIEYQTGKRVNYTFFGGEQYIPGQSVPFGAYVEGQHFYGHFPAGFLPTNAIVRWVKITMGARREWEFGGEHSVNSTYDVGIVGVPSAVADGDTSLPFGIPIGTADFGEPHPDFIYTQWLIGMYDYATDPQDGTQDLPSSDPADRLNSATNSVELSQAEFYDRRFGYIYSFDNTDTFGDGFFVIQGLRLSGYSAEVAYDLTGAFVLTPLPEEATPECECCAEPPGTVVPPAPPPAENPIEYGVTDICDEFGLIANGDNPVAGETWLY
jgi:hypothetical protein